MIDGQGHAPIKQNFRRCSSQFLERLVEKAQELLDQDIIESANAEWCNSLAMVRKPDVGYRLRVDFRKLKEVTKKDAYPMKDMWVCIYPTYICHIYILHKL